VGAGGRGGSSANPRAGSGFTLRFRMAETTSPPVALSAAWHSWWVTPCTLSSTSTILLCNSGSGKRPPAGTVTLLAPGAPEGWLWGGSLLGQGGRSLGGWLG